MEPTVVMHATHNMDIMRSESFGPVLAIHRPVTDDMEAIELMNDSEFGLTAGLFSRDPEKLSRLTSKLDVGTVFWNTCDQAEPWMPWTGRKASGQGVTLSYLGTQAMAKPKAVYVRMKNID
eukprot:TRINITY_DN23043_c0_g1_i1.p2 TRINITY_DN23043_c0_g1~~TRINITY_DN23043_c0_g1_i1.p2  ORF type:complete len:121 (+),score=26.37 TRINITY_DN23043_c0_g1_i1:37-399(+)